MAESESTGPDKLVSQVVSLWTFVFSRLITAILTLLIIWLISGNLLSSITTKLALELGSKTALLESLETIGLKDKIWIAALIGFVSILYINASLVSGVTNVIPVNVQRRPLANPSPMMTTALALLWALKSDIEDYSDLRLYVEYEFIKTTQASDVEKLTYYTELKKARRATMQARTSIYFALFAIIFYSVSDKLRWINPSAGFYLSIILVTSIGFSLTRFLAYAIHCKIMYFLFVQNLVVQLRSDDREIDWDKV